MLLNGPNINIIGVRKPFSLYGDTSFQDFINKISKKANKLGVKFSHFQSNSESELINKIQQSQGKIDFILINPGGLTHTSIVLRDAISGIEVPFYEIHITNVYARENFRRNSYFSDIAIGVICGFHFDGYFFALESAVQFLHCKENNKYSIN